MESGLKSTFIIRWTGRAFRNLEAAVLYVAAENPRAAVELAGKIRRGVDALGFHPQMGRPGRCKHTRELVVSGTPFIVAYRDKNGAVEILSVLHGAKKWPLKFGASRG